ncbi:lasso peptide biosynthesis PqqD family chaperone [Paenibacillus sp. GSMTC-2017]|uniref:lasso peptide biosynthesis PqqD family chaperone n=1 Tax=Paenibacillus sp. GSMTC-2017 TaxID=2794350 RepID=UPI0018D95B0F|nr:lasso peptide biosynthesis PqqD family chaperone [Paenibacillus sp. GSMTC-2017]MBH5317285.1 lasso peptide biosynthesis PqqD family chaperone [Paenibacillus sp. GSMTC-2017]
MKTELLSKSTVVSSCKENIVSDMGGEKVMLSVSSGNYYNLGHIGGHIWDAITEPISIQDLINTLLEQFDVDREECESHVESFLDHLRKEGLIVVHEQVTGTIKA